MVKFCTKCKLEKPKIDFVKNKRTKDGLHYYCKSCHCKANKKYWEQNKETIRKRNRDNYKTEKGNKLKFYAHLRSTYDQTAPMIYDMFFVAQKGKCFFCGTHQDDLKNRLSLEHNHTTGEFRSLCCPRCNNMIGWAEEWGLDKLKKYLEI